MIVLGPGVEFVRPRRRRRFPSRPSGPATKRSVNDETRRPVANGLQIARFSVPASCSQRATVIRDLRERRESSQEDIAHGAGLTLSSYARIERGQANPTWTTVANIARALGVSLTQLAETVERAH
jgi:DNA-binding XRE family transcriptional regulator